MREGGFDSLAPSQVREVLAESASLSVNFPPRPSAPA